MTAYIQRTVRIEWGHCDPAGIVHAPRYFDIFGESTMRLFERAGLPRKREMMATMDFGGFPLVLLEARFLAPTVYGDDVLVECDAPCFGVSSFTLLHRLLLDGRLCVECIEKRVWTEPDPGRAGGFRAVRVPSAVRGLFGA